MKTKILFIYLLSLCLFSCSDDDNVKPITLVDRDETTISLYYPRATGYGFPLQGGDGNYSVKSNNDKVITAEMISPIDLSLTAVGIGETTVVITDNSQNMLVLNISVNYETHRFIVKQHDIRVFGGDLTENEKKEISENCLAEIPVKVNGGYEFIFTDVANNKGKAIIYTDSYGSKGIETTFEMKEIKDKIIPESASWGYEVIINNEKRTFVQGRYIPSTKATEPVTIALMEDITQNVQVEYPKAELVYTSQVIVRSSY
ncbi:pilus assembly protein N-terminal domain-containing protein [Dysgonomonas sp. Marseille-P4677]|uniref:pilus assembly protein N-terminal domain-containing protein n=1 Tax=Dysgonomonas sp. Marseille-P4677 TaxID=2364790 RepID=UPI0019118AE5|nr:pilus assembly protein N-terminal domain-containing protein [Dysgonomonas sp. Marseille-P4677]MBK5722689.1 pilus assembly protein N-terminal domain-containing protein [Dysgonomonas sp. Marseille-P4677]